MRILITVVRTTLNGNLIPTQTEKLNLIRQHADGIGALIVVFENLFYRLPLKYQPQVDLLMTVLCIRTPLTAIHSLVKLDFEMSMIETAIFLYHIQSSVYLIKSRKTRHNKATCISRMCAPLKPFLVQSRSLSEIK